MPGCRPSITCCAAGWRDPRDRASTGRPACRADTNARFNETNQRLDRVERRQTQTDVRLSTELVAVVGAVREVRDLLREDRVLRGRVEDHERRIAAIETRVG